MSTIGIGNIFDFRDFVCGKQWQREADLIFIFSNRINRVPLVLYIFLEIDVSNTLY